MYRRKLYLGLRVLRRTHEPLHDLYAMEFSHQLDGLTHCLMRSMLLLESCSLILDYPISLTFSISICTSLSVPWFSKQ